MKITPLPYLLFLGALVTPVLLAQSEKATFDHQHQAWTLLLEEHVHPGGLVDYRGLAKRRGALDAYLANLEAVKASEYTAWQVTQREAFWINAYNAYTVRLILDNYPVESIRDLGGFFSPVWKKRHIPLQHLSPGHRRVLSLDEVEHGILADISRQPLFHFAIVCASTSCPELRAEAYVAAELDGQLAAAGRRFLGDETKNEARKRDGRLHLSKIFDWSEDELVAFPGGIRGLLQKYGPEEMRWASRASELPIAYLDYDWSLNEWIPPRKKQ